MIYRSVSRASGSAIQWRLSARGPSATRCSRGSGGSGRASALSEERRFRGRPSTTTHSGRSARAFGRAWCRTQGGLVWLDRLETGSLARHGFGAKVKRAVEQRREVPRRLGVQGDGPNRSAKLLESSFGRQEGRCSCPRPPGVPSHRPRRLSRTRPASRRRGYRLLLIRIGPGRSEKKMDAAMS